MFRRIMIPKTSYLVCGIPRSGTSLLCHALRNTGIAGRPEEYFWRGDEAFWSWRWHTSTYGEYVGTAIREGTTPNGVFGARVMWGYMGEFLEKLAATRPREKFQGHRLLSEWFPNLHYVRMSRRDRIAQAVSWARAVQSDVWYSGDTRRAGRTVKFDFDQIDNLVNEIGDHEEAWDAYFRASGVDLLHLFYEELSSDLDVAIVAVLGHLGIERVALAAPPALVRQRDRLNDEWVDRYRRLARWRRH